MKNLNFYLAHLKGYTAELTPEERAEKYDQFLQELLLNKFSVEKPHFYSGSLIVTFFMGVEHEEIMKSFVHTLIIEPHQSGSVLYKELHDKIFPQNLEKVKEHKEAVKEQTA